MTSEVWPPPSDKTPEMRRLVSVLAGSETDIYETADCATCDKRDLKPEDFRDNASRKEFGISRMCQRCQDSVFGG